MIDSSNGALLSLELEMYYRVKGISNSISLKKNGEEVPFIKQKK
jgi:hypothetical protein